MKTIEWKFIDVVGEDIQILNSKMFFEKFRHLFVGKSQEEFIVFWMDAANKAIGFEKITKGILTSVMAHAREVFRGAIVASCNHVILAHNHPSDDVEPGDDDLVLTKSLIESGDIIGIEILDHIIFADKTYYSFNENGLIEKLKEN